MSRERRIHKPLAHKFDEVLGAIARYRPKKVQVKKSKKKT